MWNSSEFERDTVSKLNLVVKRLKGMWNSSEFERRPDRRALYYLCGLKGMWNSSEFESSLLINEWVFF